MTGEAAGPAALGADHARADVRHEDLDLSIPDLELDRLHLPGAIEVEQAGVMRGKCFQLGTLPDRRFPLEIAGSRDDNLRKRVELTRIVWPRLF